MPAPRIQAYPMEAVIAEKLEAMVHFGVLNSRMKDFFDVWFLARTFRFEASALGAAIHATFKRRGTALDPEAFEVMIGDLSSDSKRTQWRAFLKKGGLEAPLDFAEVLAAIRDLASVPCRQSPTGNREPSSWPPGGPWHAGNEYS